MECNNIEKAKESNVEQAKLSNDSMNQTIKTENLPDSLQKEGCKSTPETTQGQLPTTATPQPVTQTNNAPHPEQQLEQLNSEVSLGFGETMAEFEDRSQTLVIREGPEPYRTILRTTIGYGIRCVHGKIPLVKVKDHMGYWLPYMYSNENCKYLDTINGLYELFVSELKPNTEPQKSNSLINNTKVSQNFLSNVQLYSIYRFQIPDGQFVSRYIFLAQWSPNENMLIMCCRDTVNIQWHSIETIVNEVRQDNRQLMDRFWGYEVVYVCTVLQQHFSSSGGVGGGTLHNNSLVVPQMHEFNGSEVLKYLPKSTSNNSSNNTNSNSGSGTANRNASSSFQKLLHEARFTEKDVIKIYCDFVQHCFPSSAMTYISFYEYINKIGFLQFDETSLRNIFRALNYKNKHFMMFSEFLLGLAALDSNAPNSKLRLTYIFRYYDRNADGLLDMDDFRNMIYDIRARTNLSNEPNEVNADVQARLSALKITDGNGKINFKSFLNEASHLTGIVHLFRTSKAILESIHIRHAYEFIYNKQGKPFGPRLMGTCAKCRPKKYSLAYHTVRLNAQGRIDDPLYLIKSNCGEIDADLQFKQRADELELKYSIEVVFNEKSVANKILSIIRKMQDFNKMSRERQKEVSQFVISQLTTSVIVQLCKEVTDIFLIEPRVIKANTPCIVIGDIHGNINDLLTYEEQLWPLAPSANSANVLFLGDYVDRGDYSIEVISYLFAMKILAPGKFFLLRGNHEIRSIQRNFTFYKECMIKYPNKDGQTVFEAFNNAFDHLPLVGIIDESIFCAHGGIPFSAPKLEELYKIPMPLFDPEIQSKPAWEILWSDPITEEEYREVCQFHNQSNDNGFADNIRRSTAYYFTEKALRNFLKTNNLSHVIRAHELEMDGYRFHHSGLLITVFSSSRYCNSTNRSAAVFIDSRENDGFIKVIALDT